MTAPRAVMTDSGFWLAFFDSSDQHFRSAQELPIALDTLPLVVPWPCVYETLSTRMVRDYRRLMRVVAVFRQPNVQFLTDTPYRDVALEATAAASPRGYRSLSLVDQVVRLALSDRKVQVSALVTFNPNDFRDVCARRGIEMLPGHAR